MLHSKDSQRRIGMFEFGGNKIVITVSFLVLWFSGLVPFRPLFGIIFLFYGW